MGEGFLSSNEDANDPIDQIAVKFPAMIQVEDEKMNKEPKKASEKTLKSKGNFKSQIKFLMDTIGDLRELSMIIVFMSVSSIIKVKQ